MNIERIEQLADYWCWAACGEMIGRYFHQTFRQCDLVNRYFNTASACVDPTTVDLPISPNDICEELAGWGLHNSRYPAALVQEQIAAEIRAQRPILAMIELGNGDSTISHLVVISDYRDDTLHPMVYRIDPFYGCGEGWIDLSSMDWGMSWAQFHL